MAWEIFLICWEVAPAKVVDVRGKCMPARRWKLDDLPKFLRVGDALRSLTQEIVVIMSICA